LILFFIEDSICLPAARFEFRILHSGSLAAVMNAHVTPAPKESSMHEIPFDERYF
jgi:hypothetical protein